MKHSKYIIYLSVFLYLFSYSYAQSPVKIDSGLQSRVQDIIKKADTYYKLSRIRNNDLIDIDKSISFFKQAEAIVHQNSKVFSRNNLKEKIQNGLEMLYAQKKKSGDKIKNYFPLYSILFGQDQLIHYFGNGHDTALENSLSDILASDVAENILPIAYSIDNNYLIEEVARNYFSKNSDVHVIGHHELSDVLTKSEIGLLYKLEPDQRILDKISDWIGQEGVGLLNLNVDNITDNLFHANSNYRFWNSKKKVYQNEISGEAYSEAPNSGSFWLILLLIIGLPMTIIYNKVTPENLGSDAPFWYGSLVALSTFITSSIIMRGLSILAIDGTILIWSPKGIWALLLLNILLSILPLFLNYVGSARVNHISKVLNNPETISSLVFGTFLGVITFLSVASNTRLGIENTLAVFIPSITAIAFPSFFLGIAYSNWAMTGEKESFVKYILFLFLLFCFSIFVLRWNQQSILYLSFGLVSSTIIVELFPKVFTFIPKLKKLKKQESIKDKEDAGIVDLRKKLKEPEFFNIIGKEKLESIKSFVKDGLEDKKIEVVFIEAKTGMGKTRLAIEIAKEVKEEFKNDGYETRILFGDCDDPQYDADLMPYEPFAQALSDELQVNRFSNPSKKAEELRNSAAGKVIGALAKGSLGPLGVLLDAEEDNQSLKADTNEIAKTISKVLAQISDGKKKVIFIIDDTQWIDQDSFDLLKKIIDTLSTDEDFKGKNKVSFIFTSRPVGEDDIKEFLKKSNEVNVNFSINQESFRNNKIVDKLIDSLNFDFQSKQKLVNYFNNLGIESPLQILQALDTVVEKKMIEIYANKFILIKSADLKTLPKPDDYNRMVEGLLEGLDPRLLDSLQCAAVIGRSFKASIIAEIFKLDILDFLVMLKGAEERNILKDVSEKDDIYEFVQKRMVGIFRNLRMRKNDNDFMPQMVREYHKRFIEIKEKYNKTNKISLNEISYRDILSMANHSIAIAEVFPESALNYNNSAATKAYEKGLFTIANKFFNNCLDIISKYDTQIQIDKYLELFIIYSKSLLDEQSSIERVDRCLEKAKDIIDKMSRGADKEYATLEIKLIDCLKFYRLGDYQNARIIAKEIIDHDATEVQKLRAKFYFAISIDLKEARERKEKHLKVIEQAKRLSQNNLKLAEKIEVWKVLSEVFNNTGFVFQKNNEPEDAKEYFNQAIKINKKPEVNDQKGISIANGGLGDCHYALKDYGQAEKHYSINLDISRNNGDKQGIGRMTSMLGSIKLLNAKNEKDADIKDSFIDESERYYNESLMVAEVQKHGMNIFFALSGLLKNFIISESYEKCEEIFNKIEKNSDIFTTQDELNKLNGLVQKLEENVPKNQFDSEIKKVKNILSKQAENKG
jgi:tetratricopeptide (TPR) repeat protein